MKIMKAIGAEKHRFLAEEGFSPTRISMTKEIYDELCQEIRENVRYTVNEPPVHLDGIQMIEGMLPEIGWRMRALP